MNDDTAHPSPSHCLNCDAALVGPRCHVCGQPAATAKLTVKHLLHEIPHAVFHIDRGLLPTVYGLAVRPGRTINDYLDGKRARYFNPLTLMMIMAGVNTLLFSAFPLRMAYIDPGANAAVDQALMQDAMALTYRYYALFMACMVPLMAAFAWLCFLGRGRCFGEHLTMQVFIAGFLSFFGICMYVLLRIADDTRFGGWVWVVYTIAQIGYYFYAAAAVFWRRGQMWTTLLRTFVFVVSAYSAASILISLAFIAVIALR